MYKIPQQKSYFIQVRTFLELCQRPCIISESLVSVILTSVSLMCKSNLNVIHPEHDPGNPYVFKYIL